jgi:K+-sensing histidine kinase KdpD
MSCSINPQGIGLGLVICNKILKQFDSSLKVESKYGQWCKFFFELNIPCVKRNPDEVGDVADVNIDESNESGILASE